MESVCQDLTLELGDGERLTHCVPFPRGLAIEISARSDQRGGIAQQVIAPDVPLQPLPHEGGARRGQVVEPRT